MRVLEMTRGFAAALREELDFRIEARNIAAVASTSRVRVPAVYGQWSTSRVLVLEYLDGVAVRHAEPVFAASGADRHGLARGLRRGRYRSQTRWRAARRCAPHDGEHLTT